MSELIFVLLLIFLCCLVGFNLYLSLKNTNDEKSEEEDILIKITESLNEQNTVLETQKNNISQLTLGLSEFNYTLLKGTRIVQICEPTLKPIKCNIVSSLDDTERGTGGFGSTGV